jgi:Hypothetical glycosyl hydrolase family 15
MNPLSRRRPSGPRQVVTSRLTAALALATAVLCLMSADTAFSAESASTGVVHYVKDAGAEFNKEDTEANGEWMRQHFTRMITYSPFFDSHTKWYSNAWLYQDAYAIYVGSSLAKEHPSWILKDAHGNPLYIPYDSPPSQYAGDISNPAFRQHWVAGVKATLAKGYRGVVVDDVDMWPNVGNSKDESIVPISGVTHEPISEEAWRGYMVTFMRELRSAIPSYEIVHNSVWYADGGTANRGTTSATVREEIEAANFIEIERGVNDPGLTGGTGPWSVSNLLTYIEEVHALGRGVILLGGTTGVPAMEYNLAAYFLISDGDDGVSGGGNSQTVKSFWSGWSINLGGADGPRYTWDGLLRRDFQGGSVYLNPPGGKSVTVDGRTLAGGSAAIIPST